METRQIIEEIKKRLSLKRFEHVIRVAETAKVLAVRFGISVEKAELAALLHDVAKNMEPADMRKLIEENGEDSRLLDFHHEIWHAAAGKIIARDEFGVKELDIQNAIRYHTTGRAGMSALEKVIYVADLIEPGRTFPGIEELRKTAELSIEEAMKSCIIHSVGYLIDKRITVFPDSFECYNEHVQR
ncbi:bis(5'-nucleosyl)-tetraphosphatase (symmetrical) YqeK [Sporosarcina thermotolerans]|uniref:bis(5'-nucleosyl)-tetraphosphatase (symmetrical) n=1 Tax=Sporosarcina thermotolerans TaxID=633404 RepID=A0AAW9A9X3_9BACL|nr:bis(5'-nucleosyl)-tetraphosphatase (symmetrical) YqeK [Sporosarcina thermotolerans]MDW0117413.1 bis(5'-nucleosyl)-tetraphosphatase (symmetrical) YqeK [Sporosarcina thermotolerans]WHT47550.1 bis(5'-nucleosyl)-tetraphosphatase (symmetrical) YqeK [Sporosarcina thermotolerans]